MTRVHMFPRQTLRTILRVFDMRLSLALRLQLMRHNRIPLPSAPKSPILLPRANTDLTSTMG